MSTCKNCHRAFDITDKDLDFYKRVGVPAPVFCPNCRRQRRLAFRNERNLYLRTCDLSGKQMVTVYSPDTAVTVFHHESWWSDAWDAKDYGQDFDFSRPFFDQFAELQRKVPRMSMIILSCENSDYAPYSVNSRNCYMCVSSNYSEDVLYSYQTNSSTDCVDCSLSYHCELCYECLYCVRLYHSFWSVNCTNSSDLYFCRDCQGCSNCIGCCNLKNKSFYIFNKPASEEEFRRFVATLGSREGIKKTAATFEALSKTLPFRSGYTINCEDVSGDHLLDCRNCEYCFESEGLEDCRFIYTVPKNAKDSYDAHYAQNSELCYECISSPNDYNCRFVLHAWDVKNSSYVQECYYSSNLFGCIGLKRSAYCILNKQYSEEEYNRMLPRIIAHMTETGEWGQYYPIAMSLFAYNESLAHEFFPLTKEEVLRMGCRWKDTDLKEYKSSDIIVPDRADALNNDIVGKILSCVTCGKNYKLIEQEFRFYKKNNLPAPDMCLDCRHKNRIQPRNLSTLWDILCAQCGNALKSARDPAKYPCVLCEACFLRGLE